jgi:hypothetical protein
MLNHFNLKENNTVLLTIIENVQSVLPNLDTTVNSPVHILY